MNWAWAGSIEQLWRSPGFPMWLGIAAACLFGVVLLVALLRAEKSVANGALALIAVLATGAAATAFLRNGPAETAALRGPGNGEVAGQMQQPALACLDDLAGDTVLAACEKLLFASPDMVAAAVSYTSARINRLSAAGDVATANKAMTPELDRLRRSIERDRYGLVAYVLASRDRCLPGECAAYASLTDHNLIAANMDEKVYEAQIERYAPSWNASLAAPPPFAAMAPSLPTGKPTNAEFPTSASIPPVNIMTPEPPVASAPAAAPKPAPALAAKPASVPAAAAKPAAAVGQAPPKPPTAANAQASTRAVPPPPASKPAPPKPKPSAPVQLAPAPASAEE